ncbi:MAG: LPXTG cell wall anchor domain-containing protein [Oscillospiraceae bacterium]|nr:LPXTG cell wall anchor domain-containing protein [Oscillospiraceae bacterium]
MKKLHIKKIAGILLAGALLAGFCVTAFAENDSNVIWEGDPEGIVISSDSGYLKDLFPTMRGMMPGDSLTQTIEISNRDRKSVRVWLRARATGRAQFDSDEEYALAQELVEKLELELWLKVDDRQSLIYRGPASGVMREGFENGYGSMTEQIFLGNYARGSGAQLLATVTAPAELDNRYQKAIAKVDWVFTMEDRSKDKDKDDDDDDGTTPEYEIIEEDEVPLANLPETGSGGLGALNMMGAAFLGAGVLIRRRGKEKK